MAFCRGLIARLAALLTVAVAITEEESCGAAGLSSSCPKRTGSEVLLQRGHVSSLGRRLISGDDRGDWESGDLTAHDVEDAGGNTKSQAHRVNLSMLSDRREMMARMEAQLVKVTMAIAEGQASRNASNTELDALIDNFINKQQESQDRCPAQLYEARHQLNQLHELLLNLATRINSTEVQITTTREHLEETLAELEELAREREVDLQECHDQTARDTEMWHTLLCELEELKQVADPAVSMDVVDGTLQSTTGSKYSFCEATTVTATTTRYEPTTTCSDEASIHINLRGAQVVTNNLGGMGPDFNATTQELRYRGVAEDHNDKKIDLVITNTSVYTPTPGNGGNGKTYGSMGTINVLCGTSVNLNIALVDEDNNPVIAEEFHFTILDLDNSKNAKLKETWYVEGIAGYSVDPNAEINITQLEDGRTAFKAEGQGFGCDNPTDPADLGVITCGEGVNAGHSIDQRLRAAMVVVKDRSSFNVGLECTCRGECESGRNYIFSGDSALVTFCPASAPESLLQLPQAANKESGKGGAIVPQPGAGAVATRKAAIAVQPMVKETKAAALIYRACLSSAQPNVTATSSEECLEQKENLEREYQEAYTQITQLLSKYEHLANSTACIDRVEAEYEAQRKPLQDAADDYSERLEELTRTLTEVLRPNLADAQAAWEELHEHVKLLKSDCADLPATESSLEDVRTAIQALEHCPGLDRGDFRVPTWIGTWKYTLGGQRTNQQLEDLLVNVCEAVGARPAYTEEIQAGAVPNAPAIYDVAGGIGNNPLVGATTEHTVAVAPDGMRVCWYRGAPLTMEGQTNDCTPNNRKAVMCVRT